MRVWGTLGIAVLLSLPLSGAARAQDTAAVEPQQVMTPAGAETAPASITALYDTCKPVIDAQYQDSTVKRGECLNPTTAFLDVQKGKDTQKELNQSVADTVTQLTKLYRPGKDCVPHSTELPAAILAAQSYTDDSVQKDALAAIAAAIDDCQDIKTGAIGDAPLPPPEALTSSPA